MMDKKIKIFIISAVVLAIVAAVVVAVVMMTKKKKKEPKKEVFAAYYKDDETTPIDSIDTAQSVCGIYNSSLASPEQLKNSANSGAQWCAGSYLSSGVPQYPMQDSKQGCGNDEPGNIKTGGSPVSAACYGIKPAKGTNKVMPFYRNDTTSKWFQFS